MRSATGRFGGLLRPTFKKPVWSPMSDRFVPRFSLLEDPSQVVRHDLDESREILAPVCQDALSEAAAGPLDVLRQEPAEQGDILVSLEGLDPNHVGVAGLVEAAPHVEHK